MKLILLGAPGSGKGTLAKKIVEEFGIIQISTGDIFRENIKNKTDIGLLAKSYIDKGQLVPDEVVIKLVEERLKQKDCSNGFILDGFPRTIAQGKSLEKIAKIDGVILIDLPFNIIEDRIVTRRVCSSCGEIYNTTSYEKNACKKCGAPLYQRDDDKLETVRNRLEVYDREVTPLINFYSGKLFKLDGVGSPDEVYERVKPFLRKLEERK